MAVFGSRRNRSGPPDGIRVWLSQQPRAEVDPRTMNPENLELVRSAMAAIRARRPDDLVGAVDAAFRSSDVRRVTFLVVLLLRLVVADFSRRTGDRAQEFWTLTTTLHPWVHQLTEVSEGDLSMILSGKQPEGMKGRVVFLVGLVVVALMVDVSDAAAWDTLISKVESVPVRDGL